MSWPFKSTVKFTANDGRELRINYLVSAGNSLEAKAELKRRFLSLEIFGYRIERVVAATRQEAAIFNLPAGCIQMLGD